MRRREAQQHWTRQKRSAGGQTFVANILPIVTHSQPESCKLYAAPSSLELWVRLQMMQRSLEGAYALAMKP